MKSIGRKRIGLVALVLVFSLLVCCAAAEETSIVASGICGTNLTWELDSAGTLTISGSGEMTDWYGSSRAPWYSYRSSICAAAIESGVASIGRSAFSGCSSLESIALPDGVTSIGSFAFSDCSSLKSITLPDGVTSIGNGAFWGCSSLESITLPEGVTSIGDDAFYGCSSLESITLPDGVTSIGSSAFEDCSSLKSITLPEGVTSIGDYAFYGCSSLASITLPEGVTSIGDDAFRGCSSLKSITIPEGVTSIGYHAFYGCSSLKSITLPEGVTSIGSSAFEDCSSLESITIPEGVTSIGDYAFEDCSSLASITLPEGVTSIGDSAFDGCSSLREVHIPTLEDWMGIRFSGYDSNPMYYAKELYVGGEQLTHAEIPEGMTTIDYGRFRNCSSLKSITLPEGVTSIGSSAFSGCSGLESITLLEGVTSIGSWAFYGCSSLESIVIPEGVTSIEGYAFYGCSSLKSITLSEGMTSIGNSVFSGCSSLTSITLPDSVTSIGNYVFSDCSNLTSVTFWGGIPDMGESPFSFCYLLQKVAVLGDSVAENIGYAFSYPYPTIYCYEYTAVDFWAQDQGYDVVYLDGKKVPESISIPESMKLPVGASKAIEMQVFPDYPDLTYTWSSSATKTATVADGVITALAPGKATVTVSCGSLSDSMAVEVYTPVASFDLSAQELYIISKQTAQLSVQNVLPAGAYADYTWSIADSTIASVSETGLVTGKVPGDTVVTVTTGEGVSRSCNVHVRLPVDSLSLSPAQASLKTYDQQQLAVTMSPASQNPSDKLISFASSNPSVASVDENGLIRALGAGTATITATSFNGTTAKCTVSVTARNTMTLPVSLTRIEAEAFENTNVEAVILPDGCTTIGSRAFAGAADLVVFMPDSVTEIADDAFSGCAKLCLICESDNAAAAYAEAKGISYRIENPE